MNLQPLRAGLLCVIVACSPGALVVIYSTRRVASLSLIISVVRVILTACQYAPSNLSCDETVRLCEFAGWLVSLFAVRPVRRHRSAHFQSFAPRPGFLPITISCDVGPPVAPRCAESRRHSSWESPPGPYAGGGEPWRTCCWPSWSP